MVEFFVGMLTGFLISILYIFIIGVREGLRRLKLEKEIEKEFNESLREIAEKTRYVHIENNDDILYAWDDKTKEFLCQFKTMPELLDVLKKKDNTVHWIATKDSAAVLETYLKKNVQDDRKAIL